MSNARNLLDSELIVINIGIEIFFNDLKEQKVKVVQVDWRPPQKLDKESEDILSDIL